MFPKTFMFFLLLNDKPLWFIFFDKMTFYCLYIVFPTLFLIFNVFFCVYNEIFNSEEFMIVYSLFLTCKCIFKLHMFKETKTCQICHIKITKQSHLRSKVHRLNHQQKQLLQWESQVYN